MCCITGRPGTLLDPLVVVPILPVPVNWFRSEVCRSRCVAFIFHKANLSVSPRIHEMLGAFFSPPYRDWWLGYVERPASVKPCHNHWLVRKSAAAVFAQGLIRFDRLLPSTFEVSRNRRRWHCVTGVGLTHFNSTE